jgi:GPH family glycoside/pentoside/hexuronide:cation symporter
MRPTPEKTLPEITLREKFSYGLGDTSANIFMGMTMMFLTIYYTDVFKLDPATMGTLFLVTRIIDAISDPLIGMIADKTKHRFGRYRPWLLWFAIPYGLSCAAVFFTPSLSGTMKTLYAYVTYISLVLTFSFVVVPYVSLLGSISNDQDERISINAIRFSLAKCAYVICALFVPTLLMLFDNKMLGYRTIMFGIGLLCTVLVLICFFNTQERYTSEQSDIPFKEQIKALLKNDQALCIFGAQTFNMIMNTLKFGALAYYVKYALSGSDGNVSFLLTAASVCGILAPQMTNYLLKNRIIGRLRLLVWSQVIGGAILLAGLLGKESFAFICFVFLISTICVELIAAVVWATIPDCADYGYQKDKLHISGIIGGGLLFSTKLGMAIGGALMGYILAFYNYDPATATHSTPDQIFGFELLFIWLPAIAMMISGFIFHFYKLDENSSEQFKLELSEIHHEKTLG